MKQLIFFVILNTCTAFANTTTSCPKNRPHSFVKCGEVTDSNFAKIQMTSALLTNFSAHRVNFDFSDFSFSQMTGSKLREVYAKKSRFVGVNGVGIEITGGSFKDANFTGANLEDCTFKGVFAPQINFRSANLKNCRFIQSYFWGAQWKDANLSGATFKDCLGAPY